MPQAPIQTVPPAANHGGHELFDMHEVLSGMIGVLDQFMIFRTFLKDPVLVDILDRQYYFILDHYNIACETFSTGTKPSHKAEPYMMKETANVTYGMKPSQPKKPNQSIAEVKDQGISGHMLGLVKSLASLLATATPEVTNPVLRRVLADSIPDYIEMAYEIFLYQNKHQYYQVPQLPNQEMQTMTHGYATMQNQPQFPPSGQPPMQ
ncbi:spore coat protein [Bacillus testis]|uniref:spore coat protein n=1 Tax=Bacillus testis TaxID=1622072 RepID=UPI00067EC17E|nr:spore coat protein [Bacillus testis]